MKAQVFAVSKRLVNLGFLMALVLSSVHPITAIQQFQDDAAISVPGEAEEVPRSLSKVGRAKAGTPPAQTRLANIGVRGDIQATDPTWRIVFQDDFEDGDDSDWEPDSDYWSVQNGEYVVNISGHDVRSRSWTGSDSWVNYAVEFSVRNVQCVDDGLVFRGGDYLVNLRHGTGWDAPDIRLWRHEETLLVDQPYLLEQNIWYRIRVEAVGRQIKVFVDGDQAIDYVDESASIGQGKIALFAWSGDCGSLVAHYDDVVVYEAVGPFAPGGRITAPTDGAIIGPGTVDVAVVAWDNSGGIGINYVEFNVYYDGAWHKIGTDDSAPYSITWQTPASLRSQRVKFGIYVTDNGDNVAIYPGGIRTVSYIESLAPGVVENWVPRREYLNQRSLPNGDVKCGATSMAMVLATIGLITPDYGTMAAKANEMYPNTLLGDTAYVYKMRDELRRQGATSSYYQDTAVQGWNRIQQEVNAGRPVIVRTAHGVMTSYGHFFVAVGYRQRGTDREVIGYDPYGRWLGTVDRYDRNSTDPSSYKGAWVFYKFDRVFGDYLITARNPTRQLAVTEVPGTPPDEVSDEPEDIGTYEGIRTMGDAQILLPLILNRR